MTTPLPHDLVALLVDPAHSQEVPVEAIPTLLCQLSALQSALASRLGAVPQTAPPRSSLSNDRLLKADDVATRANLSRDYVYRHADRFPFTRRIGRALRFSEKGLTRWLDSRARY